LTRLNEPTWHPLRTGGKRTMHGYRIRNRYAGMTIATARRFLDIDILFIIPE